jgi:hypothetical protein
MRPGADRTGRTKSWAGGRRGGMRALGDLRGKYHHVGMFMLHAVFPVFPVFPVNHGQS